MIYLGHACTQLNNRVSIQGPSNPLPAGNSYTLTCNATADITHVVRWTDPSGNSVETGEGVSIAGPFMSGTCGSEHVHFWSKRRPTTNLPTECTKKL